MSRLNATEMLMPSLLDRLIDPHSGGTLSRRGYSVEQMVDAVRRDLEDLLNTRRTNPDIPAGYPEVLASIEVYGVPDLTSLEAFTVEQREEIGRLLEQIIRRFEPRLKEVRARLVEEKDNPDRKIRFHVDAKLAVEPAPEVAFETVLELTTGHTTIESRFA
jgi:type VI secretion system protein ImpF